MSNDKPHPIEVFYDGGCPLCGREIRFIKRWDRSGSVFYTDIQAPWFEPLALGKTRRELMDRLHVRTSDGQWLVGVEAIRRLYQAVGFGMLVSLSRAPGVSQVLELLYAHFAKNRLWLTRRPHA